MAGREPKIRTVAVPDQVPGHIATRDHQSGAGIYARTNDGILRLTHRQYDTRSHRVPPEQGIRQHVACADGNVAALHPPAQHPSHSSHSSEIHPHTKGHRHLASGWARTLDNSHTPKALDPTWCGASRQQRPSTLSPNSADRQSKKYDNWSKTWKMSQTPGDHSCHHTYTTRTPPRGAPLRSLCLYTCLSKYDTPHPRARAHTRISAHGRPPAGHELVHPHRPEVSSSPSPHNSLRNTTSNTYTESSPNHE